MSVGFSNSWGNNFWESNLFGNKVLNFKVVLAGDGDVGLRYGYCALAGDRSDFVRSNLNGVDVPKINSNLYGNKQGQKNNNSPNN